MTEPQNGKYEDTISEINIKGGSTDNEIILIEGGYYFRDGDSLKECLFSHIKYDEENRYYFISVGHSRGLGFYNNMGGDSKRGYDILWNFELSNALEHIKNIEYAIFNNCNVTLFDNLVLFSRNIKFLIGTENYTSIKYFDLELLLSVLSSTVKIDDLSPSEIGQALFDNSLYSILFGIKNFDKGLEELSLFYIDLSKFKKLELEVEAKGIFSSLTDYFNQNFSDLIKIRESLLKIGSSIDTIDLISFFRLSSNVVKNNEIGQALLNFDTNFHKCLLSPYQRGNKDSNGTSIYFPEINKEFGKNLYYVDYISTGNLPIKEWYEFLAMIQNNIGVPASI